MSTAKRVLICPMVGEVRWGEVVTLEDMQKLVGGYVQAIDGLVPGAVLMCDEDGRRKHLLPNRMFVLRDGSGQLVLGDFFFIGAATGEGDLTSLTDEIAELVKARLMPIAIAPQCVV